MNIQVGIFITLFFLFTDVESQDQASSEATLRPSFRPSVAVVIGILSIMFSLTFLLLVYAKFCHTTASNHNTDEHQHRWLIRSRSRFSGIDKTVIESLPFFRFSSLKGSKEGLECAICLSKFEEIEILRLLPKCKHAFHINCVDQWLENHSSCPICRHKVDPEDLTIFMNSSSLRFSRIQSELTEDPDLELFVRREDDVPGLSSRFSVGSSFRKMEDKKEELLIQDDGDHENDDKKVVLKLKEKITVSDIVFKNRWSDVSSTDLMLFNSEMLNSISNKRFDNTSSSSKITKIEEMEKKRLMFDRSHSVSDSSSLPSASVKSGKRSMSEITNLSRFADFSLRNRNQESGLGGNGAEEERMRRLWFPIARTVRWLAAGRERTLEQSHYSTQHSMV